MAQSEPPNDKGGSFVSQLGLFAKREPGEHHADDLHRRRSVRLGLSNMYEEMRKEAVMQGISCVTASFCFLPML